jgi:hypothetical protein
MALCQRVLLYSLHSRPTTNKKRKKNYNQPSSSLPLVPLFFHYFCIKQIPFPPTQCIEFFLRQKRNKSRVHSFFFVFFSFFRLSIHCFCFISLLFYLCQYIIRDFFVSKPIIAYERNAEKWLKFNINKR